MTRQQLPEQHGMYYHHQAQGIPRRSAASTQGGDLTTGAPAPPQRQTEEDDELRDEGHNPLRLPSSARRYNVLPTQRQREYAIPLTDGTALYVTEQKLATMGRDYKAAAQEVAPGTIAQKQKRQLRPNVNKAQPPDVIYAEPARTTQAQPGYYPPALGERVRSFFGRAFLVGGIGLLIMLIGWIVLSAFGSWWTTQQNDWQYGRPRTFQIDWNVGHGTSQNPMSHFIALNLDKHIEVIEIPGNDPSKSQIYVGPQLYGPGQELTPITLSFEDVNHDGYPDLIIHVEESQLIFLNKQVNGVWKFVPVPNQQ